MKRTTTLRLPLLFFILIALFATQGMAVMEPGDFEASLAQAVERDQPLVIDFYTDW